MFLFFVGASFRLLKEESLSLQQVLMALPWAVPFLLPYLLPMAYMVTLTLVYGRMVADNEVLAFGSLGIPGRSLAWPAIILAILLAMLSAWLTTSVVPYCHQKRKEALQAVFQQLFSLDRGEGEHYSRAFEKQGFDFYVRRFGPDGMRGIVVHYDLRARELEKDTGVQIVAERGRVATESGTDRLVLVLSNVSVTMTPPFPRGATSPEPVRMRLERYVQGISLGGRRRIKALDYASADLRALAAAALRREALAAAVGGLVASQQGWDLRRIEAEIELAQRLTLAAAPLLLTLLVIPLTFLLRARSPLIPSFCGLLTVSFLYFAPLLLGRSLAETLGHGELVYLGIVTSLGGAGVLGYFASR